MTKFRKENSFDDRRKLCFSLSRCGQLNVSRQLRIMSCCRSIELNIIRKEKSHKRNGSRGRSVLHIQLMSREIRASNIHTWICMRCVNTHVYLGDGSVHGRTHFSRRSKCTSKQKGMQSSLYFPPVFLWESECVVSHTQRPFVISETNGIEEESKNKEVSGKTQIGIRHIFSRPWDFMLFCFVLFSFPVTPTQLLHTHRHPYDCCRRWETTETRPESGCHFIRSCRKTTRPTETILSAVAWVDHLTWGFFDNTREKGGSFL